MLDCSGCGWIAAVIAALAYGSFGVPIKRTANFNVDPLVMQVSRVVIPLSTHLFLNLILIFISI